MRVRLRHLAEGLALCFALSIASAGFAATIDAVAVQPGGENTRVIFDVSSRVPFQVFTLENPHRVVVDLDASRPRSGVNIGNTPVSGNDVTGIRGGPRDKDGYRIVIDVADRLQPKAYMIASPTSGGDRLVVELRGGPATPTTAGTTPSKTSTFENDCAIGTNGGCNTHYAEQGRAQRSECGRRAAARFHRGDRRRARRTRPGCDRCRAKCRKSA